MGGKISPGLTLKEVILGSKGGGGLRRDCIILISTESFQQVFEMEKWIHLFGMSMLSPCIYTIGGLLKHGQSKKGFALTSILIVAYKYLGSATFL